jgi:acyl-homoserine lactone acylase PvdQ
MARNEGYLTYLAGISTALQDLKEKFDLLDDIVGPRGSGIGSNSWAVSGQLTNTGMPLLANDPHLGAQMPSIWYEVGLHCVEKGAACPYEVTGFSFAGVPGVIIGHNDRIAWGFTNTGPDVQDLYIEKINPQNPNQYEVNGDWVDMDLVEETIQVAGSDPQELTVRYTRHGPIISDTTYLDEDFSETLGIDLPEDYAIALRWTALEPNQLYRAIWQFNRAGGILPLRRRTCFMPMWTAILLTRCRVIFPSGQKATAACPFQAGPTNTNGLAIFHSKSCRIPSIHRKATSSLLTMRWWTRITPT